jgi:hypothetical protein
MIHILFFAVLFWISFVLAKLEIAIEGKDGWAGNLPTWRLSKDHWASRLFFGGKQATGYHTWLNIFLFSFLHVVYLFNAFSLELELKLVAFLLLLWAVEDFFWFIFNPHFGFKKFKKESISWHSVAWWGIAPRDYFILIPLGVCVYFVSIYM